MVKTPKKPDRFWPQNGYKNRQNDNKNRQTPTNPKNYVKWVFLKCLVLQNFMPIRDQFSHLEQFWAGFSSLSIIECMLKQAFILIVCACAVSGKKLKLFTWYIHMIDQFNGVLLKALLIKLTI